MRWRGGWRRAVAAAAAAASGASPALAYPSIGACSDVDDVSCARVWAARAPTDRCRTAPWRAGFRDGPAGLLARLWLTQTACMSLMGLAGRATG